MNPLHYLTGTGHLEWFNAWVMPWVGPVIIGAMYDEETIEKQINLMRGVPDGKQGN